MINDLITYLTITRIILQLQISSFIVLVSQRPMHSYKCCKENLELGDLAQLCDYFFQRSSGYILK